MSAEKPECREWYGNVLSGLTKDEIEEIREWAKNFDETNDCGLREEARLVKSLLAVIDALYAEQHWQPKGHPIDNDPSALLGRRDYITRLLQANEELRAQLAAAEEERKGMREFIEYVSDGFDCDEDAHKYGTFCRCCEAEKILATQAAEKDLSRDERIKQLNEEIVECLKEDEP